MADGQAGTQVERRSELAKEIKVNDVVSYVYKGMVRNALVMKNFDPEMRAPRLSLVYVKPGEQGLTTRHNIPHRFHVTTKDDEGYWVFPSEQETL